MPPLSLRCALLFISLLLEHPIYAQSLWASLHSRHTVTHRRWQQRPSLWLSTHSTQILPQSRRTNFSSIRSHHERENIEENLSVVRPTSPASFFANRPLLAIVTEPDACSSDLRVNQTVLALERAMSTHCIDLVCIRVVSRENDHENDKKGAGEGKYEEFVDRIETLVSRLKQTRQKQQPQQRIQKDNKTQNSIQLPVIVLNASGGISTALQCGAEGIHVKERDMKHCQTTTKLPPHFLMGTSVHCLSSAKAATATGMFDYLFVGTCFVTPSHPEKSTQEDCQGPEFPGLVRQTLEKDYAKEQRWQKRKRCPSVIAIGGIDAENCQAPIMEGADGVASIRAILLHHDPASVVTQMKRVMERVWNKRIKE